MCENHASIMFAVRAIETAPEDADTESLYAYCKAGGLSKKDVDGLVKTSGPSDMGRIARAFQNKELAAAEKKAAKERAAGEADEEQEQTTDE